MNEVWVIIDNYDEMYQVSNMGRVKSFKRKILGHILTQKKHNCGYKCVTLSNKGKLKMHYVHRLVALAFIGIDKNKEVNHIDFDKTNNKLDNLEVVTRIENMLHSIKANRRNGRSVGVINNINGRLDIFPTIAEAARVTKIPESTVQSWLYGINKYIKERYNYSYLFIGENNA